MKHIAIFSLLFFSASFIFSVNAQESIYDFTVTSIDGEEYDMASLKGKKVLIVNTASNCGFTPQYEDLEKLYNEYKDQGLVIVGFPANNFMNQEPGSNEEIAAFCERNYGVTFPMMAKISVKGEDIHPLYKWLTTKELNDYKDSEVKWNFQKYLINEEGELVGIAGSKVKPYDEEIIGWLKSS